MSLTDKQKELLSKHVKECIKSSSSSSFYGKVTEKHCRIIRDVCYGELFNKFLLGDEKFPFVFVSPQDGVDKGWNDFIVHRSWWRDVFPDQSCDNPWLEVDFSGEYSETQIIAAGIAQRFPRLEYTAPISLWYALIEYGLSERMAAIVYSWFYSYNSVTNTILPLGCRWPVGAHYSDHTIFPTGIDLVKAEAIDVFDLDEYYTPLDLNINNWWDEKAGDHRRKTASAINKVLEPFITTTSDSWGNPQHNIYNIVDHAELIAKTVKGTL